MYAILSLDGQSEAVRRALERAAVEPRRGLRGSRHPPRAPGSRSELRPRQLALDHRPRLARGDRRLLPALRRRGSRPLRRPASAARLCRTNPDSRIGRSPTHRSREPPIGRRCAAPLLCLPCGLRRRFAAQQPETGGGQRMYHSDTLGFRRRRAGAVGRARALHPSCTSSRRNSCRPRAAGWSAARRRPCNACTR